jgi:hypothetical protein
MRETESRSPPAVNELRVRGSDALAMMTSPPTACWGSSDAAGVVTCGANEVVVSGTVVVVVVAAGEFEVQAPTKRAKEPKTAIDDKNRREGESFTCHRHH